jgi:N-acyl-D-amino-acid deacylase
MHDLVIRNGALIDGSGGPIRRADVAVDDGKISCVGAVGGRGRRELDARDKLVTPGFVDIHTHYDGQATWDPTLSPSSWHGVTTVVMGNCGVGFAPAKKAEHQDLIALMEGVEDIPGAALSEGIEWAWETFAEYMEALGRMRWSMDVGAQVPHGPLRMYVMGQRGIKQEAATQDDLARMAEVVREGVRAGALGFSTSRTLIHKSSSGDLVPGTFAAESELMAVARAMRAGGGGVFQMTSNHKDMGEELDWMRRVATETGQDVLFNLLQIDDDPELWQRVLHKADAAYAEGAKVYPTVAGRPAGILMGWQHSAHPFLSNPTFVQIMHDPWDERLATLRDPAFRAKVLDTPHLSFGEFADFILASTHKMYRLGAVPDYEPDPRESAEAIARRTGKKPLEVVYDWMMEDDGTGIVYFPIFNYANGHLDHMREMLTHPRTRLGLGDGGAHCGVICDASIPTFMLAYWARDRRRGETIPLERMVHKQTRHTAEIYGLLDRGLVAPGMRADLNVLDFDTLGIDAPKVVYDLPAGGRRLIQRARGYVATVCAGEVVLEHDTLTGARPGRLIRGRQADPTA